MDVDGESSACRAGAPKGQPVRARVGTPGTAPHNALRALKGHTKRRARRHRSPRWGEVACGAVTRGSAPLHLGLSPCAALRRRQAPEAPGGQRSVPRINSKSLRVANRWNVFGVPCSCPEGATGESRGGTPGTAPHKTLRALKGHTEQGTRRHRSPRWGEVACGAVTQGSAPLHLGLSPCAALRRRQAPEAPGGQRSVPRINSKSVRVANRWNVFGMPCSCPEGATGESPGWNPGNHATQRPPCPEGAHGTGYEASPFAPLGRGRVGCGDPRFAPLHLGLSPCAALRRRQAPEAPGGQRSVPRISSKSLRVANRWNAFGVPCSCPEGATGESPGWNPGNRATQRPPCPEGAHGTGSQASPFAPLGRGRVWGGDPRFRSAPR